MAVFFALHQVPAFVNEQPAAGQSVTTALLNFV